MPEEGGDGPGWGELVCDVCGVVVEPGTWHECGRVAHLDRLGPDGGADGVIWALAGARQLDANLVALAPAGEIGAHRNDEVDVLIVVLAGSGELTVDGADQALATHDLALIPCGARRHIVAGPAGMRYLSIHRVRSGLMIGSPR